MLIGGVIVLIRLQSGTTMPIVADRTLSGIGCNLW